MAVGHYARQDSGLPILIPHGGSEVRTPALFTIHRVRNLRIGQRINVHEHAVLP
jgi:hypothetical protein